MATLGIPQALRAAIAIQAAHAAMAPKKRNKSVKKATTRRRSARSADPEAAARATVAVLERLGVRWALVGAGAYSILVEPRATEDFNFVIEAEKLPAVLEALAARFGRLDITDVGAAVRIKRPALDLIRSSTHALFTAALERAQTVDRWHIPTPEVFIALKFLAAVSAWRGPDRKAQDVADLVRVYLHYGRARLDMKALAELASRVYPGAERELADLLRRVDAGDKIII
jgi:hypothetical protein